MAAFDYDSVRARLGALQTGAWPLARLLALVDAHEEGASFRFIARAVGAGVTKNACIGQAHRIGLPLRDRASCATAYRLSKQARTAQPSRPKAPKAPPRSPKPSPTAQRHSRDPEVAEALALPGLSPVRISDLAPTQCKWPVGDPKAADFAFCGRLKGGDGPYCPAHRRVAFDPAVSASALRGGLARLERLAGPIRQGGGRGA